MELFEHEEELRMTREQAAGRLRELADQLERHNEVKVSRDGLQVTVKVPDEVTFELEVEIEADESEIEVTISW
ncbi:MAG: amphi-Trp domain-containing protein [Acidimicrobiales bacterium]|nr:amphi-Trp domain-containing protein [Acidimicrobiales bacterium]